MNEIVKDRDDMIATLTDENNAVKADYESLKGIIYRMTAEAIRANYYAPKGRFTECAVRMERWTTLMEIIESAELSAEFHAWRKENDE